MKSSLGKLKKLAVLHKSDHTERTEYQHSARLEELANSSKDMQDMRNCYDSLLSAAAATANSAYEFSKSLHEMGICLLGKTSLHGDEATGRALSMLGNVQFELQRLIDSYRSHICMTVTNPSESLLHELRTVEEMKRQCDEKRDVYEYMTSQQKEKGKSKGGASQKLQSAHDEYEEKATLCVFRLKSLKQGQSRSLITQAARHHAAQLNFFRKGLKCLEAIEPQVRVITEQHHIDYHLADLDDESKDGEDEKENSYGSREDGELSLDYRQHIRGQNAISLAKNAMEVDDATLSFSRTGNTDTAELNSDRGQGDVQMPMRERRASSHSAPIFTEKSDTSEKMRYTQQLSGQKTHSYVLPTPDGVTGTPSSANSSVLRSQPDSVSRHNPSLWHSSPLEQTKHEIMKSAREVRESGTANQVPPPLSEGLVSYSDKPKRHAFSGPLTSKPMSKKPVLHASVPVSSSDLPHLVSPTASPPLVPSPRVSELHELPRPPGNLAVRPSKSMVSVGHSAPLVSRNLDGYVSNKIHATASPLPPPPLLVPQSFFFPPSSQKATAFHSRKPLESPRALGNTEEISSPPLTPIALMDIKPERAVAVYQSGPMRGGS
ncbi:hypothetical protein MLD38_022601 [Melastoma candidum]|uniref:Uncharacterized protein n=1 Tax=Melastoma candidum TaxID=119954 RepID=A0ACB9QN64_9MYRT|nr:hypothetical protein MLD38_022601 [Melastoma candidum]